VLQDGVEEAAGCVPVRMGDCSSCGSKSDWIGERDLERNSGSGSACAGYTDDWHGGRYPPNGIARASSTSIVRILNDSTIQAFAELNRVSYNVPSETSLYLVKEHPSGTNAQMDLSPTKATTTYTTDCKKNRFQIAAYWMELKPEAYG
jgi:hypothetical protein